MKDKMDRYEAFSIAALKARVSELEADLADAKLDGSRHANRVLRLQVVARDERISMFEAALRQIRDVGQRHRDPYVEGSWFAAVADTALRLTAETEAYCAPCEDGECAVHPSTTDRGTKL